MSALDITNYLDSVYERSVQKSNALNEASRRKQEELSKIPEKPKANPWVNQLGLDPDGLTASAVDAAASVVSGTSRMVGNLASLPSAVGYADRMLSVSPQMVEAFNREKQGIATPEDRALLDYQNRHGLAVRDQINEAMAASANMAGINKAFDISSIRDPSAQQALQSGLEKSWNSNIDQIQSDNWGDKISGVAGLIGSAGSTLLRNPEGVIQTALENAPQLALGAAGRIGQAGMIAANVGYAGDVFHQGIGNYAKKNQGQLMPDEQRDRNATLAATLFGADMVGDVGSLAAGRLLGKTAKDAATETGDRLTFKQALLNTAKGTGGGVASEAPTEAYQTWAEGEITGKPATGAEIFASGVIGGASGGMISGGARGVGEAVALATQERVPGKEKEQDSGTPVTKDVQEAVKAAAETGDISPLVDPTSKSYAPDKAIAALFGYTQANPDKAAENLAKADEIVQTMESDMADLDMALRPDAEIQADIARVKTVLTQAPEDHPMRPQLEQMVSTLEAQLGDKPNAERAKKQLQKQLEEAQKNYQHLSQLVNPTEAIQPQEVDSLVQSIQQPDPNTDTATSGERLISLAMTNPDALSPEVAKELADNTNNALTAEQRKYLRQFSDARVASNELRNMKDVSTEIAYGSENNLGIVQYEDRITKAIAAGNQQGAQRTLGMLANFVASHEGKAAAATAAVKQGFGTRIIKTADGWEVGGKDLSKKELRKNGGLSIDNPVLVKNINQEAQALRKIYTYLSNSVSQKFGQVPAVAAKTNKVDQAIQKAKEAVNVQNVSQQGSGTETKGAVNQAQTTKGSRQDGTGNATQGSAREVSTKPSQEAASAPLTNHTPKEYLVSDPIDGEDHQSETVRIVRSGENTAILRGANLIDITAMLNAGYSIERAIAQSIGIDTTGKNVKAVDNSQQSREALVVEKKNSESSKPETNTKAETKPDAEAKVQASAVTEAKAEGPQTQAVNELEGRRESTKGHQNESAVVESAPVSDRTGNPESSGQPAVEDNGEVSRQSVRDEPREQTKNGPNQTTEVVDEENESSDGKLSVFAQKSDENTPYQERILIADYFEQEASKGENATKRPLVMVKDFITTGTMRMVKEFSGIDPSEAQRNALKHFQKFALKVDNVIRKNLLKIDGSKVSEKGNIASDYFYNNLMQFLMVDGADGRPDLEGNVKTALALAAYNWLAESSNRGNINTDEDINHILGRPEEHEVTEMERNTLSGVGRSQNLVIDSLGRTVIQSLGLRAAKNAPENLEPVLASVLGGYAYKLLNDMGVLHRNVMRMQDMVGIDSRVVEDAQGDRVFVKLNQNPRTEALVKEIKDIVVGTTNFLDSLFGSDPLLIEPTFEPVPFNQRKVKNTSAGVPKALAEILDKENAVPSYIRQDMHKVLSLLSDEVAVSIAGGVDTEDQDGNQIVHASRYDSVQAANLGLLRELQYFRAFADKMESFDKPIFFEHVMWKPQRVGIRTNALNPQTSKIHRHALAREGNTTTVDPNNAEELDNFYLRVGEGMGVKSDSLTLEDARTLAEAKRTNPKVVAAVNVLAKILADQETGEISADDQQTILEGVKQAEEKMHSLDALLALAAMQLANGAPFQTNLMSEVDGVTNGPMLAHMLLGAGASPEELMSLIKAGGFFGLDDVSQFNEWKSQPGNLDLYERTLAAALDYVGNAEVKINEKTYAAVQMFTGNLKDENGKITKAGRNIMKKPLTATVFGSSVTNAINGMADAFVESVIKEIEKAYVDAIERTSKGLTPQQIVQGINRLLQGGAEKDKNTGEWSTPSLLPQMSAQQLMDFRFQQAYIDHIKRSFERTLGKAAKEAIKANFATFMERRQTINAASRAAFTLFNAVQTSMYKAELDRQMDMYTADPNTGIKWSWRKVGTAADAPKERVPYHGLTPEMKKGIDEKLRSLKPMIHTAFSKESKQLSAGLEVAKTMTATNMAPEFSNELKFNQPFNTGNTEKERNTKSLKVRGRHVVAKDPGVAMPIMATHSSDSYTMHTSLKDTKVLNVHDAAIAGVNKVHEAARNLNEATWSMLMTYSPLQEASNMLSRTMEGVYTLLKDPSTSQSVKDAVNLAIVAATDDYNSKVSDAFVISPEMYLPQVYRAVVQEAYTADQVKYGVLAKLKAIDQYAMAGGNFVISDAQRAEAQAKLDALEPPSFDTSVVEDLYSLVNTGTSSVKKPDTVETVDDIQEVVEEPTQSIDTLFGPLGKSNIVSTPALVEFFEEKPTRTAGEVLDRLIAYYGKGGKSGSPMSGAMLEYVRKFISDDVVVQYIDKNSTRDMVKGEVLKGARGWTNLTSSGGKAEIYILSPDFAASGLTPELLAHELVHAAVTRAIRSTAKKVQPYVNELKSLLKDAQTFVEKNGLQDRFGYMVTSLDELVAYGMTNVDFQQNVLAKFNATMPSEVFGKLDGRGKLVKAMKAFVHNLAGLLGFKTIQEANALGNLIANVSMLLNEVKDNKPTQPLDVNGSSQSLAMQSQEAKQIDTIRSFTTGEIFYALNPVQAQSPFGEHLGDVLDKIVKYLHGNEGIYKEARKVEAAHPLAAWLKAVETGQAPFASQVIASPLVSNPQQDFVAEQVEATVQAVLNSGDANTSLAYRDLAKLYMEAYKKIKPENFHKGDWATATQYEKDIAQQKYDFIFKMDSTQGSKSDYLSRFAALGLANEEFHALLNFPTDVRTSSGKPVTLVQRLKNFFSDALGTFSRIVERVRYGEPANERLKSLVQQLVAIEAKKKHALALKVGRINVAGALEEGANNLAKTAKEKIKEFGDSAFFKNSKNTFVHATGTAIRTLAGNRTDAFMEAVSDLRDSMMDERTGFLASFITELKHPSDALKAMLMRTKRNEQERKDRISQVSKFVLESFANKGKDLKEEDKAAITKVFLRTGLHNLTDQFSMTELERIVSDVNERKKAIAFIESKLTGPYVNDHIVAAKALGYFKVTGQVRHRMLMLNAGNIAHMYGTDVQDKVNEADAVANEPSIAALVSLYALSYSNSNDLHYAREVLRTENRRMDGNGVEFVLGIHKKLEEESAQRLFEGDAAQMMHGYVPEVMNPHTKLAVAHGSAEQDLRNLGYSKAYEIKLDPRDPNGEAKSLYVLKDGGLLPYVSGILSTEAIKAKGSKSEELSSRSDIEKFTSKSILPRATPGFAQTFDPRTVQENYMAPIVTSNGVVSNWRYMMTEHVKDTLMERNNNFDHLLGATAGAVIYKPAAKEQNKSVIGALKELYDAEFATNSHRYMEIGPASQDPAAREMWAMLPKETRAEVLKVWGETPLTVRKDAALMLFGARKLSAANMFQRANDERRANRDFGLPTEIEALQSINAAEKMVVYAVESVLTTVGQMRGLSYDEAAAQAQKAAVLVARAERGWQELVAEVKDIVVVKSGLVLAGNIWSNFWMLGLSGVPLKDILHHHYVAIKATTAYRNDHAQLQRLIAMRDTGYTLGDEEQIRREITRLEDAIARNPVKPLIDEGMMPSIVDDVAMDDDPYSYKTVLAQKVDKYASKLHPMVRKTGKYAYMTHDTAVYKVLSQTTQMSDFVARYTLYNYLTTREKDPMSHKDAVIRAMDSFVNYDIPMHPLMQWSDDNGLTYFTKYFLRIQREIMRLAVENPVRVLGTVAAGQYVDLGETLLQSHWLPHLGNNPFRWGALEYPGSLDDLATVSGAMALLK